MKYLFSFLLASASLAAFGQHKWYGDLKLASFDCENHQACYELSVQGIGSDAWALGDQNYRFLYDAERISIESVVSLLPNGPYSQVQLNEDITIAGQGQEAFSPLDAIDHHLGFLDFSIISYSKQNPAEAIQINGAAPTPVAKICIQVAPELMENIGEEYAVQLYFSRPATAGQVTNQFSVISEVHEPNRTCSTQPVGFVDLDFDTNADAKLGEVCQASAIKDGAMAYGRLRIYPNPSPAGREVHYESYLSLEKGHSVLVYNEQGEIVAMYDELPAGNDRIKLPDNLAEGVYFVKVKSETIETVEELVVMRF